MEFDFEDSIAGGGAGEAGMMPEQQFLQPQSDLRGAMHINLGGANQGQQQQQQQQQQDGDDHMQQQQPYDGGHLHPPPDGGAGPQDPSQHDDTLFGDQQQQQQQQQYVGPSAASVREAREAGGRVYIANLAWWTTDADVEAAAGEFGRLGGGGVQFLEERGCGRSKGAALVEFEEPEAAAACKEQLAGRPINGRPCVVVFATSSATAALERGDRGAGAAAAAGGSKAWGSHRTGGAPTPPPPAIAVAGSGSGGAVDVGGGMGGGMGSGGAAGGSGLQGAAAGMYGGMQHQQQQLTSQAGVSGSMGMSGMGIGMSGMMAMGGSGLMQQHQQQQQGHPNQGQQGQGQQGLSGMMDQDTAGT